jgi:hypothetical protein
MTRYDNLRIEGRFWDFCGFLFAMAGVLSLGLALVTYLDERSTGPWLAVAAWIFGLGFWMNIAGQLLQIHALLVKMADGHSTTAKSKQADRESQ